MSTKFLLMRVQGAVAAGLLPIELLFRALADALDAPPEQAQATLLSRLRALEAKAVEAFTIAEAVAKSGDADVGAPKTG